MAKFKDLRNGKVYDFSDEETIYLLRKSVLYEELEEEVKEVLRYVEKIEPRPKPNKTTKK
jgi:hypothetical protein